MKTLYKSSLVVALGVFALTANAQDRTKKDTTLTRQVMVEREYNPILKDASKVNTVPEIYNPVVKKANVSFVESVPQISVLNNRLGGAQSGDIATNVDFDKKRGYLVLGAGNNSNLEGAAGYQILRSQRSTLNLYANHSSSNSDVDFESKDYWFEKSKAKYSDTKVNLDFAHAFDLAVLNVGGSFFNTAYNYYGNSYLVPTDRWALLPETEEFPFNLNSRQNVDVISFNAGIRSSELNEGLLKYDIKVAYDNFKSKYGWTRSMEGPKGGIFNINGDFNTEFASDKTIGVEVDFLNQSFNKNALGIEDGYHKYNKLNLAPYFNIEGGNWDLSLGVNVAMLNDVKTSFMVGPNVSFSYKANEVNVIYAKVGSKVNDNTFLDILQENRYVNLLSRVEMSKTYIDGLVGFKSGVVPGFEFNIFAGYKITNKEHLYVATYIPSSTWMNMNTPVYADLSTGTFGASVKTSLIPYTDLSAKLTGHFYSVKYKDPYVSSYPDLTSGLYSFPTEKKAWGLPTVTGELNADVKVIPNLVLSMNYLFMGGRKAYLPMENRSYTMKAVNELNFRGEYQLLDWFAVNVKLNNVLGQKYELQPGYARQGFNILGGVSFRF